MALSRNQSIVAGIIGTIAMIIVMAQIYSLAKANYAERSKEPRHQAEVAKSRQKSLVLKDRIVLTKNDPVTIPGAVVTYRGMERDVIHLGVVILALDPNYTYPKQISKAAARKGFLLGDHPYRLVSAGGDVIELRPVSAGN
jgi:hypothetical protein